MQRLRQCIEAVGDLFDRSRKCDARNQFHAEDIEILMIPWHIQHIAENT